MEQTMYKWRYRTPEGFDDLLMSGTDDALTGLLFEGSRDMRKHPFGREERELPVFRETRRWLDIYFSGRAPDFTPPLRPQGLTPFRQAVVDAMLRIPFGETVAYRDIALALARRPGAARPSARAVGGAVGWNPICLIIPCHRVVGADGSLTGYGGGVRNKAALLAHENGARYASSAHGGGTPRCRK